LSAPREGCVARLLSGERRDLGGQTDGLALRPESG